MKIQRILISVTDKSELTRFTRKLKEILPEAEIIASGGTAGELAGANIPYTALADYTGFPECFDGRLKTLHPKIAGGLLLRREKDEREARKLNILPIDLLVCNLYDFAAALKDEQKDMKSLMEAMDIGGCTLIRAAAKNFTHTLVVTDPRDYDQVLENIALNEGFADDSLRRKMAVKALNLSASYEALLATSLSKKLEDEESLRVTLRRGRKLRYGENPDQQAWIYGENSCRILAGGQLSYNNYLDVQESFNAAGSLLDLDIKHGTAIIKHCSLCALATGESQKEAFRLAWAGDPKSSFGSVITFTRPVEMELVDEIAKKFIEIIIAPDFDPRFIAWTKEKKPRLRLLKISFKDDKERSYRKTFFGWLSQTAKKISFDAKKDNYFQPAEQNIGVVTEKCPEKRQRELFAFGVRAVNFAKSNAVAIVREVAPKSYQLLGLGSGQPNRVDCLERLALPKACENLAKEGVVDYKKALENVVLVSDGFFPFDDSVKFAAEWGIKYCVQPGGSIRDQEVIAAADRLGVCMIFTGERYFSH